MFLATSATSATSAELFSAIEAVISEIIHSSPSREINTLIEEVGKGKQAAAVIALIERGIDDINAVNPKNYLESTALWEAACWGLSGIVDALLKAGANPLIKNIDGRTALDTARFKLSFDTSSKPFIDTVELLGAAVSKASAASTGALAVYRTAHSVSAVASATAAAASSSAAAAAAAPETAGFGR